MSSSLFLQQFPACLVLLIWIDFVMGVKCPYNCCFVGCYLQDLFNIVSFEVISLHTSILIVFTVKWFQLLQSNSNNSKLFRTVLCTHLTGWMCCYLKQSMLFNTVKQPKALPCNTLKSIKVHIQRISSIAIYYLQCNWTVICLHTGKWSNSSISNKSLPN